MDPVFELTSSVGMVLKVYEDYLILTQKGVMGVLTRGLSGEKTIYYNDLTSVQFKEAKWTAGFIEFTFAGSNDRPGGSILGASNENRYTFSNPSMTVQKQLSQEALKVKEYIDEKIRTLKNNSKTQGFSVADEILKFKQLFDAGIITKDEFEKKKLDLMK